MRLTCLKSASVCHHHCYIKEQQTPKTSRVYSSMNQSSRNGPTGAVSSSRATHKAARKSHAIWCLMVSFIRPQVGENPNLVLAKRIFFRRRHKSEQDSFMMIVFKSLPNILGRLQPRRLSSSIMNQWCVSSSILIVLINEWWIINRQSSIISPWLPWWRCVTVSLVERWRTAAFSQFCLQIALPYIKRAIASL